MPVVREVEACCMMMLGKKKLLATTTKIIITCVNHKSTCYSTFQKRSRSGHHMWIELPRLLKMMSCEMVPSILEMANWVLVALIQKGANTKCEGYLNPFYTYCTSIGNLS
jgi:uncharacterized membrane protein